MVVHGLVLALDDLEVEHARCFVVPEELLGRDAGLCLAQDGQGLVQGPAVVLEGHLGGPWWLWGTKGCKLAGCRPRYD